MKLNNSYVAGLFDGEGWFQIDRSNRKDTRRGVAYQVHARICMRDRELMFDLRETFGGSVRQTKKRNNKHADYYSWDVCGFGVLLLVKRIGKHLIVKKSQAELAAKFQRFKATNKNRPCDDARFSCYTEMYEEMKRLNVRGTLNEC